MKRICIILAVLTIRPALGAVRHFNPFTGYYKNQIAFNFAQGIDNGFILPPPGKFVPFFIAHIQYSQPTTFFRIPARQSINIAQTLGFGHKYGWDWGDFVTPMIFISGDVMLLDLCKYYLAGGAGIGLQAQENERLGAKLLFQLKITAGWHIDNKWGLEIYMQHFSNANTAPQNHSYAFYGLGITYNF